MPRGKSTNDLKRRSRNKESRSYFLIVVEGEKTEHNYFNSLKLDLALTTIDIKVVSACGGDPLEVINKAHKLFQDNIRESKKGNTLKFDKVFCVFDDDNKIKKFQEALLKAKENNFVAITSIPCFEFWILLHYCYTTSYFGNYQELCPRLETEMRKSGVLKKGELYDKSDIKLYEKLKPKLEDALSNANKLEQKHPNEDGCTNPSTKVHILVKELQDQKEFKSTSY